MAGRIFLFKELEDLGWTIKENTKALRWNTFLEIQDPIYSRLVHAFYATAISHKDLNLESQIKGVSIVLTPEKIAEALGIPEVGLQLFENH